ncbi:MAG: hemin ABC transporter ATP-binding protein [Chloroflexi bacterium]|nr:MAG: hemin ABC transporter ATP-binding protein [Chloroflexota bacterium]
MPEPLVSVTHLTKTYESDGNEVQAVRDVSFSMEAGEFLAIVGPSGSGKTTLLAMLGGLLTPSSGSIIVAGREISTLPPRARAGYRRTTVGFIFQQLNLFPYLTARENVLLMRAIGACGPDATRQADQLLAELGLKERANTQVSRLSGGERQRVAIARALMNDPAIVLADEPTSNLDSVRGAQVVRMLIDECKARNKLTVMVTHDREMADMADRILEMHDGHLTGVLAGSAAG